MESPEGRKPESIHRFDEGEITDIASALAECVTRAEDGDLHFYVEVNESLHEAPELSAEQCRELAVRLDILWPPDHDAPTGVREAQETLRTRVAETYRLGDAS